jgi:hypothetical protein
MAIYWDINLIDTIRAKMCTGCKFESECHPPESEQSMESMNIAQMCICADENVKNTFRPEERYYTC